MIDENAVRLENCAVRPALRVGKWQISIHGGSQPRWRGDGRELFFLALDGKLMAADIRPARPSPRSGMAIQKQRPA